MQQRTCPVLDIEIWGLEHDYLYARDSDNMALTGKEYWPMSLRLNLSFVTDLNLAKIGCLDTGTGRMGRMKFNYEEMLLWPKELVKLCQILMMSVLGVPDELFEKRAKDDDIYFSSIRLVGEMYYRLQRQRPDWLSEAMGECTRAILADWE